MKEARWIDFPSINDERGSLTAIESGIDLPFRVKRLFYLHGIKEDRGGHAHTDTDQLLIALNGSLRVRLYDGKAWSEFILDQPGKGLFVPRMLFIEMDDFSEHALLLVLANTHYDITKSIRSLEAYKDALKK